MYRGIETVKTLFEATRKSKTFGQALKHVKLLTAENGQCTAELTVQEEHLNLGGTMHGGFTSTLIDCISSYAVMTQGNGGPGVSVDLHVSFMKAAFPGDVLSVNAKTLRCGRTLAFLEVEVLKKEDGALIARGSHTKFVGP